MSTEAPAAPRPSRTAHTDEVEALLERFRRVRAFTERMCEGMEPEDYVIQSMADVSPTKWHLAHTTWFFEAFLLEPLDTGYRPLHPQYNYLFNSYYNTVGEQFCRPRRGQISRPTVREVYDYRRHVDEAVTALLLASDDSERGRRVREVVLLGTHHEQQHQELMATDIKHVFSINPIQPAWRTGTGTGTATATRTAPVPDLEWIGHEGGLVEIGYEGPGFHFDNERSRHRVYLEPFELASRLVTNGEYATFMEDRGYERPELWLSMGWAKVQEHRHAENAWERFDKPLYWFRRGDAWWQYTASGPRPVDPSEPVVHVSYYEADAFARWSGARLPTEFEWEASARPEDIAEGTFSDAFGFHPRALSADAEPGRPHQMFGDVWEWTSSAYAAYPGFEPWAGAAGEYNGKFMANQLVLRGGSCATAMDHIRPSYRNFFYAGDRWQFMGLRLARNAR